MNTKTKTNHSYGTKYLSPLEMVDRISKRYIPKKVEYNEELKKLYENGECGKFEFSPSSFKCFYINRETSMENLNDLIDYAEYINSYTIDTEDQSKRSGEPSEPALIQIEFVHERDPPIIILIETFHLPPMNSPKFNKIKHLCQTIFSPQHMINCWGNAKEELKKFVGLNIISNNDIGRIEQKNIQNLFKTYYNTLFSQSIHCRDEPNYQYSLQKAIKLTFNEWFDKRMTLANWSCGIDPSLRTFESTHKIQTEAARRTNDEKEIRILMGKYAAYDCLAVTKLYIMIKPFERTLMQTEPQRSLISDYETADSMEYILVCDCSNDIPVHESDEQFSSFNLPEQNEPNTYSPRPVEEQDETTEKTDDIQTNNEQSTDDVVNVDESNKHQLTPTQHKNQKRRAKRYQHEVIRTIYWEFTITDTKMILISMNIYWDNINIVGRTLFIGLLNEATRQRAERMIDDEIFTKEHYLRIQRRRRQRHQL